MINYIILKNFQRHEKLKIDFCNGINIIHGESDKGKSSIRRAIEWICFNQSIDGIRKTGTKQTSVILGLKNDIEIERVRSTSINRYILRINDEEKVFDSIGKSIPEEIQEVLNIYPVEFDDEKIYLNSQNQLGLPFLMDKSPSVRMKLFNKLSGNDVLDKLFSDFNKDIARIKRRKKEEVEKIEEYEVEIKQKKKEVEKKEIVHKRIKNDLNKLKEKHEKYLKLLELKDLQSNINESIEFTEYKLKSIKIPQDINFQQLREKIERLNELKSLKTKLLSNEKNMEEVSSNLSKIVLPDVNIKEIRAKIERYQTLSFIKEDFDVLTDKIASTKSKIKELEKDIILNTKEYKKLLKEIKICPTCKQEITDECLKEIKL